jgi:hypothetical protein
MKASSKWGSIQGCWCAAFILSGKSNPETLWRNRFHGWRFLLKV